MIEVGYTVTVKIIVIEGSLNKPSDIRPNRLFTAEKSIFTRKFGTVKPEVLEKVLNKLCEIIKH